MPLILAALLPFHLRVLDLQRLRFMVALFHTNPYTLDHQHMEEGLMAMLHPLLLRCLLEGCL